MVLLRVAVAQARVTLPPFLLTKPPFEPRSVACPSEFLLEIVQCFSLARELRISRSNVAYFAQQAGEAHFRVAGLSPGSNPVRNPHRCGSEQVHGRGRKVRKPPPSFLRGMSVA